jgi:acetyltransferase-like isoleucine patch superfamily enzyme
MSLKEVIKSSPKVKKFVSWSITPKQNPRPRFWIRWFVSPIIHKKGRGAIIRRHTRLDVFPWNKFIVGKKSTIEDFVTINNGVGDIFIGNDTLIGIGNTIIGPVYIGDHVILAQNVVVAGLNHGYQDVTLPIKDQPVTTAQIRIEDEVWIGANSTVLAGITIGKHSVIAAGSVVSKDIPPYSVAVGNPVRVIKQFNSGTKQWERI